MTIPALDPYSDDLPEGSILVPLSLYDEAGDEKLLRHAAALARREQRPLLVMHAVHEPAHWPGMYLQLGKTKNLTTLSHIAKAVCVERLEAMQARFGGLTVAAGVHLCVVAGLPESRIVQVAKRAGSSTIILPDHRTTGLDRLFAFSTVESVIRHAHCPVTLVGTENATVVAPAGDSSIDRGQPAPLTHHHA